MTAPTTAATHCPYCALQCGMTLTPTGPHAPGPPGASGTSPGAAPLTVTPREFPTNRGGLCQKGWTSATLLRTPDRIVVPLVRDASGELVESTWDDALGLVAARVRRIQVEHGRDAVAVFGGGGLTNEKAYALGKFARTVLRTRHIDYNGRFCMASAAAGAKRTLGLDRGLPFPLSDVSGTTADGLAPGAQAVVLLGSNLAETMPPSVQHLDAARAAGGLVVVDPRRSATAALTADGKGVHLQPIPGTDLVVLLALQHVLWTEGLVDEGYLRERTKGADGVRRAVTGWWPERAETVCGVPAPELRRVARLLADASPSRGGSGAYILTGRGVEQSTQGTATVTAAIDLALTLGLPGRIGSGYGAITGQGNGQGGREHGQKNDQLPGYRMITDPAAREHVAGVWAVDPSTIPGPGMPAVELLRALGTPGGPRALFVHGSNLVVSAPDATKVAERLRSLDLLVVCDLVPSETARLADVVLPVTQWAEEEGTLTSLEGRVIRRRRAVDAPGEARSELWILAELARRLGSDVSFSTDPAVVFDELARASAGGPADYSGLSHAVLDADEAAGGPGLYWPAPAPAAPSLVSDGGWSLDPSRSDTPSEVSDGGWSLDHPRSDNESESGGGTLGTPRVFLDRFATPDGRARMVPVDHVGPSDDVRPDAPICLVTGRVLQHYQSGAQTHRVPELERLQPEAYVELHPLLGDRIGVADGDLVEVASARGVVRCRARWTDRIRTDTVFMPFHWAGAGSANVLTTDATDPISGMPEFKVCAVDVRPLDERSSSGAAS